MVPGFTHSHCVLGSDFKRPQRELVLDSSPFGVHHTPPSSGRHACSRNDGGSAMERAGRWGIVRVQPRVNSPAYSQPPMGHGRQKDHERPREDMEVRFLLRKLNITA